jgi:hypothetical protein
MCQMMLFHHAEERREGLGRLMCRSLVRENEGGTFCRGP